MSRVRVLELFAGIGGFSEAAKAYPELEVVCAIDIASHVLQVHQKNHEGEVRQANLCAMSAKDFEKVDAQLWWMSPPCQPYTVRGAQKDLEDHRAASLLHLIEVIAQVQPPMLAMENVGGFASSQARERLLGQLEVLGYKVLEVELCPTQLGIPAKRERYYMVASLEREMKPIGLGVHPMDRMSAYLDPEERFEQDPSYWISEQVLQKHGRGMKIVDPWANDGEVLNCFTSAYGKTYRFSGAYFRQRERVRYATPEEVARTLGFSEGYRWPKEFTRRQRYKYLGNSLSIPSVKHVLGALFEPQ